MIEPVETARNEKEESSSQTFTYIGFQPIKTLWGSQIQQEKSIMEWLCAFQKFLHPWTFGDLIPIKGFHIWCRKYIVQTFLFSIYVDFLVV